MEKLTKQLKLVSKYGWQKIFVIGGPIKKFNDWIIEKKNFYYSPSGQQKNIAKYGCLYTWDQALKVVPQGWHLPQMKEFNNLSKYFGLNKTEQFKALAALEWNGDNPLGFNALPSGGYYCNYDCDFGTYAIFWSATEVRPHIAYYWYLGTGYTDINISNKTYAFSVRCIKD